MIQPDKFKDRKCILLKEGHSSIGVLRSTRILEDSELNDKTQPPFVLSNLSDLWPLPCL